MSTGSQSQQGSTILNPMTYGVMALLTIGMIVAGFVAIQNGMDPVIAITTLGTGTLIMLAGLGLVFTANSTHNHFSIPELLGVLVFACGFIGVIIVLCPGPLEHIIKIVHRTTPQDLEPPIVRTEMTEDGYMLNVYRIAEGVNTDDSKAVVFIQMELIPTVKDGKWVLENSEIPKESRGTVFYELDGKLSRGSDF